MDIEQPTYETDYSEYNEAQETSDYKEALKLQTEKNEINLSTTEPTTAKKPAKQTSQRFEKYLPPPQKWVNLTT